jgi:site-specific recombinase XerD
MLDSYAKLPVQEDEGESQEERSVRVTRRRFQEGCVFKRGIRRKVWVGRWREWAIGNDGKPKRILRSEVLGPISDLPTRREARKALELKLVAVNEGRQQPTSAISFRDFVERHWKPAMLPMYKQSTSKLADLVLEKYLLPSFGERQLCDLGKAEVQAYMGSLLNRLAPDTVHGIHRFLRRILECAVDWNFIPANPARRMRLPPCRRREPPFIRPKQFERLLKRLREPYRTMVLLAMMTSMRVGEILALRWGRVDLQNGTIRVSETFHRGHFGTVKSQRSNRQIPLSPLVLIALRNLKRKGKAGEGELVFATRNRTPLSDGNVLKRVIYPACDKLKVPRLGWHAMRHLHSTLLSQLGVPVAVAQAQLGHADPRTTLSIYTHVLPGAQREAVVKLERHLFPNVPKLHQNAARAAEGNAVIQ